MVVRNVSAERISKAAAVIVVFLASAGAAIWYSQQQGWALITELSLVLFLFIVFAIVYDHVVIR